MSSLTTYAAHDSGDFINPLGDSPYFLDQMSDGFEAGATIMAQRLSDAMTALEADATSPSKLAAFQTAMQSYQLFRNAQTSTAKTFKDIGSSIIQNFR
jgi:type III secretion protein F